MKKTASKKKRLEGTLVHRVYSPRGAIEGLIVNVGGKPVQLVIDKHDEAAAAALLPVKDGQSLTIDAESAAPSPKGAGVHPVYDLRELLAVDGQALQDAASDDDGIYRGRVQRFNYARHGEINGVVLDNGDFLHLKPEGYASLGLQVGDAIEAEGPARPLVDARGRVVDATVVNGRAVARH